MESGTTHNSLPTCFDHLLELGITPPEEIEDVKTLAQKVMVDDLYERFPWIVVPFAIDIEITEMDAPWSTKK